MSDVSIKRLSPKHGLLVLYPASRRSLPPEGAEVEMNSYWIRRLNDGDVIEQKSEPVETEE